MSVSSRVYEVYIEDAESNKHVCFTGQKYLYTKSLLKECSRLFGEIPYESVVQFIDLERAVFTRSVLVLEEDPVLPEFTGLLVEKSAQLCLQEVRGKFIYFLVSESSQVKRGDIIAYHVTGKFEVRNVKSLCEGVVVLIIDMPWEVPRKALVVVTSEPRRVVVEKTT
ncbi:MAG: DUF2118 domain-containing protein [Desulfurococcaceae archaeon]